MLSMNNPRKPTGAFIAVTSKLIRNSRRLSKLNICDIILYYYYGVGVYDNISL